MKSPYGWRGVICSHFGWTYDYLLHGITWSTVQKMMLDAPSYDFSDEHEDEVRELKEDNGAEIMDYVNSLM